MAEAASRQDFDEFYSRSAARLVRHGDALTGDMAEAQYIAQLAVDVWFGDLAPGSVRRGARAVEPEPPLGPPPNGQPPRGGRVAGGQDAEPGGRGHLGTGPAPNGAGAPKIPAPTVSPELSPAP